VCDGAESCFRREWKVVIPLSWGHRLLNGFGESTEPVIDKNLLFGQEIVVFVANDCRSARRLLGRNEAGEACGKKNTTRGNECRPQPIAAARFALPAYEN